MVEFFLKSFMIFFQKRTGGILRKIKSEIEKSLPTHERQGPIPISRHERRSREWLEIGIGPCLE